MIRLISASFEVFVRTGATLEAEGSAFKELHARVARRTTSHQFAG